MIEYKLRSALPRRIVAEIDRLCQARSIGFSKISEMRLREDGRCSVTLLGEKLVLFSSLKRGEAEAVLAALCDEGMYNYRDSIKNGYVTVDGGVRIGLVGRGGYSGDCFVGLSELRSLIFRIPQGVCDFNSELSSAWERAEKGILIFSPPGVGKTTALRQLVRICAVCGTEVAVIDERCEFLTDDYRGLPVDIYRGFGKAVGAELALRCIAPGAIAMDEIGGSDEADAVSDSLLSGVKIIATAHSGSIDELFRRKNLQPILSLFPFDVFCGIKNESGRRTFSLYGRDGCVI